MKALRFHEFGDPQAVLRLEELPDPEPGPGQVLVRLTARSVNPSDLYTVMGVYGVRPTLPAVPGNEGAGVVERVGDGVSGFQAGDRVTLLLGAVPPHEGTWRELAAIDQQWLIKTPPGVSDEQAATAWVNYLTAWILAFEEFDLKPGEQVLVTAGASHLGRAMLQLAAHKGFKVIATVRRDEQKQELLDLGAAAVIATDSEDLSQRAKELTGGKGFKYAIDAVSGRVGTEVVANLAPRGVCIIYGLLSQEPIQIDGRIIFTEAVVRGFWLVRWLQHRPAEHVAGVIATLTRLFADGTLVSPIDSAFDLSDIAGMLERSNAPGRQGKVVITGPAR
ncbi:MAG TPA: zinc-dependent alcohol dehydrogenase family protein [Herpetosiphonaceae bacterium]